MRFLVFDFGVEPARYLHPRMQGAINMLARCGCRLLLERRGDKVSLREEGGEICSLKRTSRKYKRTTGFEACDAGFLLQSSSSSQCWRLFWSRLQCMGVCSAWKPHARNLFPSAFVSFAGEASGQDFNKCRLKLPTGTLKDLIHVFFCCRQPLKTRIKGLEFERQKQGTGV
eukprot:810208-Rhodomonas_salina.1